MKITCSLILSLLAFYSLYGQHVDVEGDTRIEGKLNIIAAVGDSSIFIGANAGINTLGTNKENTFIGANAGQHNITGSWNTMVGKNAGRKNTSGNWNTFLGKEAGLNNTTGNWNTYVGMDAGQHNITGSWNTMVGQYAGNGNITGDRNTFLGHSAGLYNTSGGHNTFLGNLSGNFNETGSQNTIIGNNANVGASDLVGAIAIGYRSEVHCDSCAVIGSPILPVNLGLGTSNPSNHKLYVTSDDFTGAFIKGSDVAIELGGANSSFGSGNDDAVIRTQANQTDGDLFLVSNDFITFHLNEDNNPDDSKFEIKNGDDDIVTTVDQSGNLVITGNLTENSDQNLKYQINALSGVLPRLLSLAGYSYLLKDRPEQGPQIGLIAQEVEAQFPDLVHTNEEGVKSVNYTRFVPILIEGLKAQAKMLKNMQTKFDAQITALQREIDELSN